MALRLSDDMTLPEDLWHFGLLSFDDGGMKCLAGALVWVGLGLLPFQRVIGGFEASAGLEAGQEFVAFAHHFQAPG